MDVNMDITKLGLELRDALRDNDEERRRAVLEQLQRMLPGKSPADLQEFALRCAADALNRS